jgi:hypothetical protein
MGEIATLSLKGSVTLQTTDVQFSAGILRIKARCAEPMYTLTATEYGFAEQTMSNRHFDFSRARLRELRVCLSG